MKSRHTFFLVTFFSLSLVAAVLCRAESTCHGTPANGSLQDGVALPARGKNFAAYSRAGVWLGRTFVHEKVKNAVVGAYAALELSRQETAFVYGETGWRRGGRFRPHKTHRNGTSVDFMVPVKDRRQVSVPLPTSLFNKFGYAMEFDGNGQSGELQIDFEAMAAHLLSIDRNAKKQGIGISRVIFDPSLQPLLFAVPEGPLLRQTIRFSEKSSWVRHDEHYHVDFAVPCQSLEEK